MTVLLMGWIMFTACMRPLAAQSALKVRIKAAMLHKFLLFSDLPERAYAGTTEYVGICVLGPNSISAVFAPIVGTSIKGRLLQVHVLNTQTTAFGHCQLLYFPPNLSDKVRRDALLLVQGRPIVTVGESADFMELGGIINLHQRGTRIGFEVNAAAAAKVGIKFRAQMLRIATRVIKE